jgi:hypothetical protein
MGRLKEPALGKLSGRVGNIVGRDFGYDHFISVRPEKYIVKKKFTEVSSKQRFYNAVKLAKTIVKFPELKKVWDKSNMPGKRGYNRIISANYKFLMNNNPTTENIITPKGRALFFDMLEVNNKSIRCSFSMAGLIEPPLCLTYIILFYNPIKTEYGLNGISVNRFFIKPEHADRSMDKKGEQYISNYCFDDITKINQKHFRNAILYAAVVGNSTIKNKKWWTSTVAIDISSFKLRFLFLQGDKPAAHDKDRQKNTILQKNYSRNNK